MELARLRPALGVVAGGVGLILVLVGAFALDGRTPFPGTTVLLPVGGALLLILAGTMTSAGIPQIFTLPTLTWIGDRSTAGA